MCCAVSAEPTAGAEPAAGAEGPLSLEEIRTDVAQAAGRPLTEIDPAGRLTAQGLDSLTVMVLAAKWSRRGLDLGYAELIAKPVLQEWLDLARSRGSA